MIMKRAGFLALLLTLGCVMTSQAVVIGWAAENIPSGTGCANLVYVSSGSTIFDGDGQWASGVTPIQSNVTGAAIDGSSVFPQESTDSILRTEGNYYVVLFDSAVVNYSVSTTALAYNDGIIGTSEFDPVSGYFTPDSFTAWASIPEPSTAMLLVFGAAAVALRRRKQA